MKPPYTERYVRWCERTAANHRLLLDWFRSDKYALSFHFHAATFPDGALFSEHPAADRTLPEPPHAPEAHLWRREKVFCRWTEAADLLHWPGRNNLPDWRRSQDPSPVISPSGCRRFGLHRTTAPDPDSVFRFHTRHRVIGRFAGVRPDPSG